VLLEKGADLTVPNIKGWTPLNSAADSGHIGVVQLLLGKGAHVDLPDGQTPLTIAAEHGSGELVALLLLHGADAASKDFAGRTPLFDATRSGNMNVFKTLLAEHTLDSEATDCYGPTLLSIATRHGHQDLMRLLLSYEHTDPSSVDLFGRTVVSWARDSPTLQVLSKHAMKRGLPIERSSHAARVNKPYPDSSNRIWCDICTLYLSGTDVHYECNECNGGDFVICVECRGLGASCLEETHTLVERTGT
jgi:hypothetical protein